MTERANRADPKRNQHEHSSGHQFVTASHRQLKCDLESVRHALLEMLVGVRRWVGRLGIACFVKHCPGALHPDSECGLIWCVLA